MTRQRRHVRTVIISPWGQWNGRSGTLSGTKVYLWVDWTLEELATSLLYQCLSMSRICCRQHVRTENLYNIWH